ncbi:MULTISPECIES: hypothetical protein [Vibrio]|uniref:hypothetical protein n=1 Tax=Vibrio TaxID=662 RepID=UPI001CDB7298|nr:MULTISPECIES: hypothetical protein [Vibrio]MCA2422647.1 hypothetical protein [Vibrio alginolyticus]MCA2447298.1 hypothetical protein [Vibrio alginolyticus]MDW2067426.1 hypothetical protein [Vibrio sp. 1579]MDW2161446.1 hypothetical protein [Vibrio sp. 1942]MDW2183293.1 hypothetical protein [Vibrio sp. 1762]
MKLSKADRRVRITTELEDKILKLAGTTKFNDALPTLEKAIDVYQEMKDKGLTESFEQAIKMYTLLKQAQESGSKFYEIDKDGERYIVRFI